MMGTVKKAAKQHVHMSDLSKRAPGLLAQLTPVHVSGTLA